LEGRGRLRQRDVARLTQAGSSAVIKNPMIQLAAEARDVEQSQVGAHWQSSASWQQTIAHFLDFVFCLQSAEIIDQYYVDDSSIILDIIGKNSASRLVDG
jgi:hypothetical protein